MKMELQRLNHGALFDYGGVRWAALDSVGDGVLCLAADTLFNRAFDAENRNNWAVSTLRAGLSGELADKLKAGGADLQKFVQFRPILTSNDGMKLYGSTIDGIALLTCDQYRQYRHIIPQATERWWTVTPYSCGGDYAAYVCAVNRDGSISSDAACCEDWGVRPVCVLEYDTLVDVEPKERPEPKEPQSLEQRIVEAAALAACGQNVALQITVHVERVPVDEK